eukprot:4976514-Pleurochrysis_carterae.AAC.1
MKAVKGAICRDVCRCAFGRTRTWHTCCGWRAAGRRTGQRRSVALTPGIALDDMAASTSSSRPQRLVLLGCGRPRPS